MGCRSAFNSAPGRPKDRVDLDEVRKPAEVLRFMGLKRGDRVLDYFTGTGYYAEIMARAVGSEGRVLGWNSSGYQSDKVKAQLDGIRERNPNFSYFATPATAIAFPKDGFDFAMLHLVYHDTYWESAQYKVPRIDPNSVVQALWYSVKPGGTVAVIDHVATPGGDTREVVEKYGDDSGWAMANPVGTGPYRLKEWRRTQKIVLEANPGYRDETFPESSKPEDRAIMKEMRGKKIPAIGRIEINIIEESNPRLLAFRNRELDYLQVPSDLVSNALGIDNKLKPEFVRQGIVLARGLQPAVTYTYFNMEDPVVGGYAKDKIALRRALSMAYNVEEEIRIIRQGQGEPATQPIPPTASGYDATIHGNAKFDPAGAKSLLDRFGYVDRDGDGWRDMPGGEPLKIMMAADPSALTRQYVELWQRSLNAIGVRVEFLVQKWPDLLKMARSGQLQMWFLGQINTTPEGFGFMSLLYGPHSGIDNFSRFNLPEFNKLYEQAQQLPESPERARLFRRMSELVNAYAPWMYNAYRYENVLVQPWVRGFKHTVFEQHPWRYYDIDVERRNAAGK